MATRGSSGERRFSGRHAWLVGGGGEVARKRVGGEGQTEVRGVC